MNCLLPLFLLPRKHISFDQETELGKLEPPPTSHLRSSLSAESTKREINPTAARLLLRSTYPLLSTSPPSPWATGSPLRQPQYNSPTAKVLHSVLRPPGRCLARSTSCCPTFHSLHRTVCIFPVKPISIGPESSSRSVQSLAHSSKTKTHRIRNCLPTITDSFSYLSKPNQPYHPAIRTPAHTMTTSLPAQAPYSFPRNRLKVVQVFGYMGIVCSPMLILLAEPPIQNSAFTCCLRKLLSYHIPTPQDV
jgi:hypothetical protein